MKYELHDNLVLTIKPETREEQALVNLLEKMKLTENGHGIENAGASFEAGRRSYLGYRFVNKDNKDYHPEE
ncbi:MAG: hypothetical protein AAF571_10490 [Verrucomicrobiota bacterium]